MQWEHNKNAKEVRMRWRLSREHSGDGWERKVRTRWRLSREHDAIENASEHAMETTMENAIENTMGMDGNTEENAK